MSALIDSPVFGVITASAVTVATGVVGMIARLISKVNQLSSKLDELARDFQEARDDKDVVRWSTLASTRIRRRKRVW
jgi:outer membrane murein-binding lipoprotein Lpp